MLTTALIVFAFTSGTFLAIVVPIMLIEKRRVFNILINYRLANISLRYRNG